MFNNIRLYHSLIQSLEKQHLVQCICRHKLSASAFCSLNRVQLAGYFLELAWQSVYFCAV